MILIPRSDSNLLTHRPATSDQGNNIDIDGEVDSDDYFEVSKYSSSEENSENAYVDTPMKLVVDECSQTASFINESTQTTNGDENKENNATSQTSNKSSFADQLDNRIIECKRTSSLHNTVHESVDRRDESENYHVETNGTEETLASESPAKQSSSSPIIGTGYTAVSGDNISQNKSVKLTRSLSGLVSVTSVYSKYSSDCDPALEAAGL